MALTQKKLVIIVTKGARTMDYVHVVESRLTELVTTVRIV